MELYLYPQGAIDFPRERGPHYICPQCHIVTDTAQFKPRHLEEIKPLDVSLPSIVLVPEDKGSRSQVQDYDPEPNEEQWLKSIGATLISKTIYVKSDF